MRLQIFLILFLLFVNLASAQTIYSNGTGGGTWSSGSTWLGGTVPGATDNVMIAGTDSVLAASTISCNDLTVLSGGKLATGVDSLSVAGTFTLEADAWYYNSTTKATVPGLVKILDHASNYVHIGTGTMGGALNNEFGNVFIQRTAGATAAVSLTIWGNLTLNNNAYGTTFRGSNSTFGSMTHTVKGNVYINKGTLSGIDVGTNETVVVWNIEGDVFVKSRDARLVTFSSANAAGLSIINIKGNLTVSDTGRFGAGTSSSAGLGTGIFNLYKNLNIPSATISTNTLGPFAINFVGDGTQTVKISQPISFSTNLSDTIASSSKVIFELADTSRWRSTIGGSFVVNGSLEFVGSSKLTGLQSFTLNPNATLKLSSPYGITQTDTLGNILVTGTRSFSPDANYEYKGTVIQVWGDGLPNPVKGLTINNSTGMVLTADKTITGSLNIKSGDLALDGFTLTIGADGVLTETAGNTVTGSTGKVTYSKDIAVPSSLNAGGLGFMVTSGVNLGTTSIERFHSPRKGGTNEGIARYYKVTPTTNTGLNATIRLYYDDSELNNLNESDLIIYTSTDGSDGSWSKAFGTVNTTAGYVEVSGINSFNYLTLGASDKPLPVENESIQIPDRTMLFSNYPNPFNPETRIKYRVGSTDNGMQVHVVLNIYDVLGNLVASPVNSYQSSGVYQVSFNASSLSSGIYFYELRAGQFRGTKSMIYNK